MEKENRQVKNQKVMYENTQILLSRLKQTEKSLNKGNNDVRRETVKKAIEFVNSYNLSNLNKLTYYKNSKEVYKKVREHYGKVDKDIANDIAKMICITNNKVMFNKENELNNEMDEYINNKMKQEFLH